MPPLQEHEDAAAAAATKDPLCTDPHLTDPPLLRSNSVFRSYKTSHASYRDLRIFYRQHAKAAELSRGGDHEALPLLVCIPGLGGTVAQFHPLLNSLIDLAPCLCIDYPGMGRSHYDPSLPWAAYTAEALGELLETVIEDFRDREAGQTVVLIGHSMGTAHAAWLANTKVKHTTDLASYVVGLVGLCPPGGPMDEAKTNWARRLMWVPGWLFDLMRYVDGIGGPDSASVTRFVGADAEPELRLLQFRYNKQSRTPIWRRMVSGALPSYVDGKPQGGLPGLDVWAGLDVPVYLIGGAKDTLTPPSDLDKIIDAFNGGPSAAAAAAVGDDTTNTMGAASAAPIQPSLNPTKHIPHDLITDNLPQKTATAASDGAGTRTSPATSSSSTFDDPSTPKDSPTDLPPQPRHPSRLIQSIILPPPANHALLYMPRTVRAVAGLISDFLATSVTRRLSLGWQLQYLSREGKWDVKNLNKWRSVAPVSEPIGPPGTPIFRALKTLREADDLHCPRELVANWGTSIRHVVDISKDQPVYDPRGLERAGIQYHKFPTVSKVPPTADEVADFIALIDRIRSEDEAKGESKEGENAAHIGVHCHYGFNRTGYFIVCYLKERCQFTIQEAIDEFASKRPNGIKHSHFLDRLHVRYDVDAVQPE